MKPKFPPSVIAAMVIAAAVAVYFVARGGLRAAAPPSEAAVEEAAPADQRPTVIAAVPPRAARARVISLNGRTEASRTVVARAETVGVVVETSAIEGERVAAGDVLCRLSVEARSARVEEARAILDQRRLELRAAEELGERGHRSVNQIAAAQAAFDAAGAALAQARIELANLDIEAPFDGVFDDRLAEVGDYLQPGDPCGVVAERDPILIVAQAPERDIAFINEGERARVRLATGAVLNGVVRFVQWRADPDTRTFRVEIEAANPDGAVRSGMTARADIDGPVTDAALVPTGVVALDDAGRLGVRVLDADDIVRFRPITILEDAPDGVWVSGVDAEERVITRGQEYVREGRPAVAVIRDAAPAEELADAGGRG